MALVVSTLLLFPLTQALQAETLKVTLPDSRFYRIDLPANPEGAPLIVALHGGIGDPDRFAENSGLAQAAVDAGFAVAFPAGSGRRAERVLSWNAGYCCAFAQQLGVDDMAFLQAVIADARKRFALDPGRVYLTGSSNGAMLAEAFAARYPDQVRAVAGVAGTMDVAGFPVQGRVPLLIIHGTLDQMVPYAGGVGPSSLTGTDFASVESVVAAFLAPWGEVPNVTEREIDQRDDGTLVRITDHFHGGSVVLRLITVEGGGHHWPGGWKNLPDGGATQEIEANAEILRFFALHP
jgi:polyhydroxybutyrate depolymerase